MDVFFPEKTTRFSSLLCLVILTVLMIAFFLAVPQLIIGTAGKVFAGVWCSLAGMIFIAHARRVFSRPSIYDRRQLGIGSEFTAQPGQKHFVRKGRALG